MKTISVKCEYCGNLFEKSMKEYNRCSKLGRKHFCNLSCSGSHRNEHLTGENRQRQIGHLKALCKNREDEFTPFRYFIYKVSRRDKEFNLTPEYLKSLWDDQKGICPYTGIKLHFPKTPLASKLRQASLDRIDSSKGYIKGNVEFVCLFINFAKNGYDKKEVLDLISDIKNGGPTGS